MSCIVADQRKSILLERIRQAVRLTLSYRQQRCAPFERPGAALFGQRRTEACFRVHAELTANEIDQSHPADAPWAVLGDRPDDRLQNDLSVERRVDRPGN